MDIIPAKKMQSSRSDRKGKSENRSGDTNHTARTSHTTNGLSELLPLSRPIDCSGVAVTNIAEHEIDRISYSPNLQQSDGARVRTVDVNDTMEIPVRD